MTSPLDVYLLLKEAGELPFDKAQALDTVTLEYRSAKLDALIKEVLDRLFLDPAFTAAQEMIKDETEEEKLKKDIEAELMASRLRLAMLNNSSRPGDLEDAQRRAQESLKKYQALLAELSDDSDSEDSDSEEDVPAAPGAPVKVDVYLTRATYPSAWDSILGALHDIGAKPVIDKIKFTVFSQVEDPESYTKSSTRGVALIVHFDTGRWKMNITEKVVDAIFKGHERTGVILLKNVNEDALKTQEDVGYSGGVISELSASNANRVMLVNKSEGNTRRLQPILQFLKSVTGS